jgi:signal peptidase I
MLTSSRIWGLRLLCLAGLVLAGLLLVPSLLGFQRYVITGGSMAGSYDPGSIVYERTVPVDELQVGDVITYDPPAKASIDGLVTHRIVAIDRDGREPLFRTKGDANRVADPWRFSLDQPTQAKAAFAIPYLGYAFAALDVRIVRMLVIGIPALLIAIIALARLGADIRRSRTTAVRDA